ncbi:ATP-grasp domain-containing protein [Thermoflexus sp.]|uniref:D-alanine--D-alanine ligase family protein n=1 Tax=Thermoflexus sp. TaxID=1969742 RepID=UPI0035E43BC9
MRRYPSRPRTMRQVILLYNIDSAWPLEDQTYALECVRRLQQGLEAHGLVVQPVEIHREVLGPLAAYDPSEWVVFNWCEALEGDPYGEPRVARALESAGFLYTGSGPWALTVAGNKALMKAFLTLNGIPTPPWRVCHRLQDLEEWSDFPAIVKPIREHGSVGITPEAVVTSPSALRERVQFVLETLRQPALVEVFIPGRELNVSLWGNGDPEPLPISEILFDGLPEEQRIVDQFAKWDRGSERYRRTIPLVPAPLDEWTEAEVVHVATLAYRALRVRDYGRVDIRLAPDGTPYVIDVNPNPDISLDAGFVRSAAAAGYDYGRMAAHILRIAWARRSRRAPASLPLSRALA